MLKINQTGDTIIKRNKGGIKMSTNDYVKFITQQFVSYIDQPKEQRKETKLQRKSERAPLSSHWFGIVPLAFSLIFKRRNH